MKYIQFRNKLTTLIKKKAMRIISKVDYLHHDTRGLFYTNKSLNIYDLYEKQLAIVMFKHQTISTSNCLWWSILKDEKYTYSN